MNNKAVVILILILLFGFTAKKFRFSIPTAPILSFFPGDNTMRFGIQIDGNSFFMDTNRTLKQKGYSFRTYSDGILYYIAISGNGVSDILAVDSSGNIQ